MDDTLGKRICAGRKRLGLTQEQLAEQLCVTAQAVSKWENGQSCPDIAILPKLAQILGITTDELLGVTPPLPAAGPVTVEDTEPQGLHIQNGGQWELKWDGSRRATLMLAVWTFLSGLLFLLVETLLVADGYAVTLWEILWPMALLVFGSFGLFPKFSLLRLGCAMAGGYYLLIRLHVIPFGYGSALFLPLFLMLLGAKLLSDAVRKPKNGSFHISRDGRAVAGENASYFRMDGERFACAGSFGEKEYFVQLSRLSGGEARTNFGSMTVDLTGCKELASGAVIDADCTFGELTLVVPRQWRVVPNSSTSFADENIQGAPDPDAADVLNLNCHVSFGELCIRYI